MTEPVEESSGGPLDKLLTPSQSPQLQTTLTTIGASLLGVLIALGISAFILAITGKNPIDAFTTIIETAGDTDKLVEMLDRATPLIFSAVAVAIGFKMNLFNIGVEGQYLFAALIAAEAGSNVSLPAPLHVAFILIVAMCAGAAWASIAAVLKAYKDIHEVISTIMLNFIGLSVIQWLFENFFREDVEGVLNVKTEILPESARMPTFFDGRLSSVFLLALVVIACGPRPSDDNTTAVGRPSDTTFLLRNHSRENICYVHIASADSDWGLDRLGPTEVILPGAARDWDFAPGEYKIRLQDCNRNDLMLRIFKSRSVLIFIPKQYLKTRFFLGYVLSVLATDLNR